MMLEQLNIHIKKKINLNTYLAQPVKIISGWVIDLNVKPETTELLEDSKKENVVSIGSQIANKKNNL